MSLGERLRIVMDEQGWTPVQLAAMTGQAQGTIYNYLSGKVVPRTDVAELVLRAVPGLSARWLLMGEGSMHSLEKPDPQPLQTEDPPAEYMSRLRLAEVELRMSRQEVDFLKRMIDEKDKRLASLEEQIALLKQR
jgi:transcriptional regulator with XRE-family HTH domain